MLSPELFPRPDGHDLCLAACRASEPLPLDPAAVAPR